MLSSFYDSQGRRYDTIYRDDIRYRIRPQLQSTEYRAQDGQSGMMSITSTVLAIFASRCGDKTRKSQKARDVFALLSLSRAGRNIRS